ncbi:cardiolipin synthase [Glaciimonas sp. CA11.2]|uniref:cardiolipin synthase n=1 Tax=Glaciimonas sp. CA11.2 TaxID=3048601 RepID=UPI002AB4BF77|nr:cardiolipin synthase [Glaciimonas sp. CA11.2]MDY7548229.1 cardiolipin synthase [Glaciimonas sp. CA11.2]
MRFNKGTTTGIIKRINTRVTSSNRAMLSRLQRILLIAVLGLTLSSCASLPDIRTFNEQPADGSLAIKNRPENARPSSILVSRLSHSRVDLHKLAALEDAAVTAPPIAGNKITLLFDGPQTLNAMIKAIANAKNNINFETYIFDQDALGMQFANLLIEKQRAGIQVNIIYDSVGTIGTPTEFFDRMRSAGIKLVEFNPVNPLKRIGAWRLNNRDHRKILVVDGKIAFTGGVNISAAYANSSLFRSKKKTSGSVGWRDTHIQIEGPAVAFLQLSFMRSWAKQGTEDLPDLQYFPTLGIAGDKVVRVVISRPRGEFILYKAYIQAFQNAKKTIHITTPYFAPDQQMVQVLIDAARRGVEVSMIFPSVSDSGLASQAGQSYYHQLLAAGIKIYRLQVAILHAKTAVIDGNWSTVGSANLDIRSFLHNYEANVIIMGDEFGSEMENAFDDDLSTSDEITAEAWDQRSLTDRIKEWAARSLGYWL